MLLHLLLFLFFFIIFVFLSSAFYAGVFCFFYGFYDANGFYDVYDACVHAF
jgi:hypothetical protein